jgi:hypothetical protein
MKLTKEILDVSTNGPQLGRHAQFCIKMSRLSQLNLKDRKLCVKIKLSNGKYVYLLPKFNQECTLALSRA